MRFKLTEKEQKARDKVCLALDVPTLDDARMLVKELHDYVRLYKIGKELFTSVGPAAIKVIQGEGGDVFLDLKFKDIPPTVRGAARAATGHGVYMFNVHATGGSEMMRAAMEGAKEGADEFGVEIPKVTAVTLLTSINQKKLNKELKVHGTPEEYVLHLAKLTERSGLDGIVCSAADLHAIRNQMRPDFMYVTPGIKAPWGRPPIGQKRISTPGNAVKDGSTILVIGRAITEAPDRVEAAHKILQDMAQFI